MRANVVFFVLLGLLALLVGTLVIRGRDPHVAPVALPEPAASSSASAAASASGAAPAGSTKVTPGKPKPKLGRPLRIVGLGWDAIAAGALSNGGLSASDKGAFAKAGLQVELEALDAASKVEKALARGGSDEDGADVAILPLPTWVAGSERLRALNLVAFYVVAWSRGRDLLISKKALADLPPQGEIGISGGPGDPATLLGLFALDLAGVDPARIQLGEKVSAALLTTKTKGADKSDDDRPRDVLMSTSDAGRLIPWLAVTQRSLVTDQPDVLIAFTKAWHAGQQALDKDAASASRTIGTLDGAPEPLTLLERLGELEPVTLAENAELFGLSGRGAITVKSLFDKSWLLWKNARVLTTPAPERTPTSDLIVAGLARAEPKWLKTPAPSDDKRAAVKKAKLIAIRRVTGSKLDDDVVISELGLLAGIFQRSPLKLTVHGATQKQSAEIVQRAAGRYALDAARIALGKAAAKPNVIATIEIVEPN